MSYATRCRPRCKNARVRRTRRHGEHVVQTRASTRPEWGQGGVVVGLRGGASGFLGAGTERLRRLRANDHPTGSEQGKPLQHLVVNTYNRPSFRPEVVTHQTSSFSISFAVHQLIARACASCRLLGVGPDTPIEKIRAASGADIVGWRKACPIRRAPRCDQASTTSPSGARNLLRHAVDGTRSVSSRAGATGEFVTRRSRSPTRRLFL